MSLLKKMTSNFGSLGRLGKVIPPMKNSVIEGSGLIFLCVIHQTQASRMQCTPFIKIKMAYLRSEVTALLSSRGCFNVD